LLLHDAQLLLNKQRQINESPRFLADQVSK